MNTLLVFSLMAQTMMTLSATRSATRRAVTLSKLAKFQRLRGVPIPHDAQLVAHFGSINSENDRSDVRLLVSCSAHEAADFIVSQDIGLRRRADRAGLGGRIFTVEEALEWLKQSFTAKPVVLPYVIGRKAYELHQTDPIFESLRFDYPGFDAWFDKRRRQHRDCWVLEIESKIAGLVIHRARDPRRSWQRMGSDRKSLRYVRSR